MKDKLKEFEKIKAILLNDKIVLGYTLFDNYVSFKYQDGNDGMITKNIFFKDVKLKDENVYVIEEGFAKEGKSSYFFRDKTVIEIK